MIAENRAKAKLKNGQPVFGVISPSHDPMLAELAGLAGFDYFMLDAEHGAVTPAQAVNVVRACETVGLTPLARVGPKDPKLVLQYLDAGMMGIMMPGLMTPDEVRRLVAAVKYPPQGERGLGLVRAADYAPAPGYVEFANAQTLVLIQFEHPQLLDRFGDLAGVPGVDGVMIGPRDLSLNMGYADSLHHPEVQAVIDRVIEMGNGLGVAAGMTASSGEAARAQVARGARLILLSISDLIFEGARRYLKEAQGQ